MIGTSRISTLAVAVLIVTALAAPAVGPVKAQSDATDFFDDLWDTDDDTSRIDLFVQATLGLLERYTPFGSEADEGDVETYADNVQSRFNSNNQTLMNWSNSRTTAKKSWDTVVVRFNDRDGNTEWRYIVADVNTTSNDYESATMMDQSDFKSEDRTVDGTLVLSPYASRNADAELKKFINRFAENDNDITKKYLARMAGKYRGEVSGSAVPEAD